MTDNTQPDVGSTYIIRYALELGLLWIDGDGRNKVREALEALDILEAKLESVGAGGVQALSAAPNGWESVIDEARSGLQDSEPSAFDNSGYRAFAETVLDAVEEGLSALAASPTPPAEQQSAPKAAPGDVLDEALRERDDAEDFIDALLDEVLGHERPEWSSSYGHADALNDVQERMTALHKPAVDKAWGRFQSAMAAPQQEAQEPALFVSAKQLAGLADPSHATAGSYLPARKTRAGRFTLALYTTPQPAPAPLSEQDERTAFEVWASRGIGRIWRDATPGCTDCYQDASTNIGWRAWQARAVLAKWGTPQPVVREPLTEEQISDGAESSHIHIRQRRAFIIGARFAERVHGIKQKGGS